MTVSFKVIQILFLNWDLIFISQIKLLQYNNISAPQFSISIANSTFPNLRLLSFRMPPNDRKSFQRKRIVSSVECRSPRCFVISFRARSLRFGLVPFLPCLSVFFLPLFHSNGRNFPPPPTHPLETTRAKESRKVSFSSQLMRKPISVHNVFFVRFFIIELGLVVPKSFQLFRIDQFLFNQTKKRYSDSVCIGCTKVSCSEGAPPGRKSSPVDKLIKLMVWFRFIDYNFVNFPCPYPLARS